MLARSLAAAFATLVLAGCSAADVARPTTVSSAATSSASSASSASSSSSATKPTTTLRPVGRAARVTKLLVVVVENHSLAQMARSMPFTFSLAKRYGYADHYTAARHPSLPNYLAIASGSTQGVTDDAEPSSHPLRGPTVFGAALAKKKTAAVYMDAMTTPCQSANSGRYAVRHNPWAYFVDERAACQQHDLPLASFEPAVRNGTLPNAGMLIPDVCHDAHDCSLAEADAWFRARMQTVMAGPDWRSGRLAVVLTADEDDRRAGNRVLTVVAHPSLSHVVVRTPLTHYSLTRLYAEVTGAPRLGQAEQAPSMASAFGLPTR